MVAIVIEFAQEGDGDEGDHVDGVVLSGEMNEKVKRCQIIGRMAGKEWGHPSACLDGL